METRTKEGIEILALSGSFDRQQARLVRRWMGEAIAQRSPNIVINLSGVQWIDLAALSVLFKGKNYSRQLLGDVKLCGLEQNIRAIFEMLQLNLVFEIYPTEEEAIQAFTD